MSLGTRYPCLRCGCTYESEWEATDKEGKSVNETLLTEFRKAEEETK